MSLMTSLFSGVSGLNSNGSALSVVGDNIANMNTASFKASRVAFADIMAASQGGYQIGRGVTIGDIAPVFTQGSFETTENSLDLAVSGNGFFIVKDQSGVYYTRDGQCRLDKDGYLVKSNGMKVQGYRLDAAGNSTGALNDLNLFAASSAPRATTGATVNVNLNSASAIPQAFVTASVVGAPVSTGAADPVGAGAATSGGAYTGTTNKTFQVEMLTTGTEATATFRWTNDGGVTWSAATPVGASVTMADGVTANFGAGNYDAGQKWMVSATAANQGLTTPNLSSNHNTAITVYDSLGNPHAVTVYFRKSAEAPTGNTWNWYAVTSGSDTMSGNTEIQAAGQLVFNSQGALYSEDTTYSSFNFNGGAAQAQSIAFDFGDNILTEGGTGYKGSSQFGSESATLFQTQDGYSSGALKSVSIGGDGVVTGSFTNGQNMGLGIVALANFTNVNGLTKQGNGLYGVTNSSGQPLVGQGGKSGMGSISSNSIELSNVDLAAEFVKLITFQRGFQANSKTITTTDEMLNDVVNLKR
jgi:flagellar hook protein FlgE